MSAQVSQLQQIMQGYFSWHKARLAFTGAFIVSVTKLTPVNLVKLTNGLNGKAKQKSNDRRGQRFFAGFTMPEPEVARFSFPLFPTQSALTSAIDRTNWKLGKVTIHILTAGIIPQGVAFPIGWMLRSKRGHSHPQERIALMRQGLQSVPHTAIRAVVADREFSGQEGVKG